MIKLGSEHFGILIVLATVGCIISGAVLYDGVVKKLKNPDLSGSEKAELESDKKKWLGLWLGPTVIVAFIVLQAVTGE